MKVAIQLVTWNSAKYIPYLLDSLRHQTFRDWELYIWDNASLDETVVLIEQMTHDFPAPVRLTKHHENSGFSQGHNQLFRQNTLSYVLLLNPDMYLPPDCLEKLMRYAEAKPGISAISPRLMRWNFAAVVQDDFAASLTDDVDALGLKVFHSRRVVEFATKQPWSYLKSRYSESELPVFGVSGAFPLYRRDALEDIAFSDGTFFDEHYHSYKEDVDLAYRLQARGYEARVLLDVAAYHDRSGAGAGEQGDMAAAANKKQHSPYTRYHSYKNHIMTLYKNEYWQNLILDFPWIFWYELKKFAWFLFFDRKVLGGIQELWKLRKILQQERHWTRQKRKLSWREMRRRLFV